MEIEAGSIWNPVPVALRSASFNVHCSKNRHADRLACFAADDGALVRQEDTLCNRQEIGRFHDTLNVNSHGIGAGYSQEREISRVRQVEFQRTVAKVGFLCRPVLEFQRLRASLQKRSEDAPHLSSKSRERARGILSNVALRPVTFVWAQPVPPESGGLLQTQAHDLNVSRAQAVRRPPAIPRGPDVHSPPAAARPRG